MAPRVPRDAVLLLRLQDSEGTFQLYIDKGRLGEDFKVGETGFVFIAYSCTCIETANKGKNTSPLEPGYSDLKKRKMRSDQLQTLKAWTDAGDTSHLLLFRLVYSDVSSLSFCFPVCSDERGGRGGGVITAWCWCRL